MVVSVDVLWPDHRNIAVGHRYRQRRNVIIASAVVAQNESTAQILTTTTNDSGEFVFPSLRSGSYTIFVLIPGFKTFEMKNLKLEIGEIQTIVQVSGDEGVAQVYNEVRISDTFERTAVSELPLPQRDVFALSKLSAGATAIAGAANSIKLTDAPDACRYCTLHQVLGLRRLNVDPKKLLAMKKDDYAHHTPRELIAVAFARKLTKQPASITDKDFAKLKQEFGESGAVEAILQTGAFAFMNRFTDGLRLPSEDEAVKTYKEIYGDGSLK